MVVSFGSIPRGSERRNTMGLTKFPNGVASDVDGYLYAAIADISSAGSSFTVALPHDVQIVGGYITAETAVTVADAAITFEIGGTLVTGMDATIAFTGAADGDAYAISAPTSDTTLSAGTAIEVITDGGSTTASLGRVAIAYKRV
jgi:hypothetical protein